MNYIDIEHCRTLLASRAASARAFRSACVFACACLAGASSSASPALAEELTVDQVFVQLIQQTDLSAASPGLLVEVNVKPGDTVNKGQAIAKLDDRHAVIACEQARVENNIAQRKAADRDEIELSEKILQQTRRVSSQKEIEHQAAALSAENDLAIQAAKVAGELADNQLQRAIASRKQFADSVSQAEIEELTLEMQHARLAIQQAQFQHQQNQLTSKALGEAFLAQQHTIAQQEVRCKQAVTLAEIAMLDAQLTQAALDAAQLQLDKLTIRSSLDGVVAEVDQHPGQWVNNGDRIVRILRLDRLQVEGYLSIDQVSSELIGAPIRLTIEGFANQKHEFDGLVTYLSSEVDAVNQEIAVRAEFTNNKSLAARPGMKGTMKIIVERP